MDTNPLKTALGRGLQFFGYVRVSTIDQATNTSLDFQAKQIEDYCRDRGINIVRFYQDIGSAADVEKRPEFIRMMEDIAATPNINGVVASRLDRLSRNVRELLTTLDDLKRLERQLTVLDLPIDPMTAVGRLMYTIIGAIAELERTLIWQRTQNGRLEKRKQGGYSHGAPRFGMRAKHLQLELHLPEQAAIQLISQLRKKGLSLRAIADVLTAKHIPTKRGGRWHPSIVSNILKALRQ